MSEELDDRQKGDIYWKKLKRYLEARASRESSLEDTDSALATARDIYACAKNLDEFEVIFYFLVDPTRIELATPSMPWKCSSK